MRPAPRPSALSGRPLDGWTKNLLTQQSAHGCLACAWLHNRSGGQRRPLCATAQALASSPKPRKQKDAKAQFYSDSLNLPKTAFPLRADAGKREQLFWARTTSELYGRQAANVDRPLFVLHDGPPYANGNLHCGHALNKITKDIINRSKLIQGHRVHYVPGYDTHGLPLELKALAALKKPASQLGPETIRAAARQEALRGIESQGKEFRSFACMGAFDDKDAYKTLDWQYEKRQLGVVRDMVSKGLITSHHRPTLYSPSSRTALAEAELEYKEDHISRSVYVAFPVVDAGSLGEVLHTLGMTTKQLALAAWTTTAWTLPSNKAIAIADGLEYSIVEREASDTMLVVATERIAALEQIFGTKMKCLASFEGSRLLSTTYCCPLSQEQSAPRPVISAAHVTAASGTGLVHTAPAHGVEDWQAWRDHEGRSRSEQLTEDVACAVDADGKLSTVLYDMMDKTTAEKLIGKDILSDGTSAVIGVLQDRGTLLQEVEVQHKFPYDWRTKKPVIFRASSQWFANLETVKEAGIGAINKVQFVPDRGRKTLEMFVRGRSEWCISRQRAWGVPIPVVYSYPADSSDPTSASTPYLTPSNVDHIISVLDAKGQGTDYWWTGAAEEFVEPAELERSKALGQKWRKGLDTMDVWFDSGCSWTMLRDLRLRAEDKPLADVYLEGSDQHRGWFQSSLLTYISSSDTGNKKAARAPYGTVITHGMVLDEQGRKMSKSLGNILSPATVIKGGKNLKQTPAYGTDLLRVWVASVDWTRDVLIGPGILSQTFETLRKMRNTARFILGNTASSEKLSMPLEQLSLLDRYVLHELHELDQSARADYNSFAFSKVWQALAAYTNTTLAVYFDVVKDALYADAQESPRRQAIVFTLRHVLQTYTQILAPLAPLLAEEIHHYSSGATKDPEPGTVGASSVFDKMWTEPPSGWRSDIVKRDVTQLLAARDQVLVLLERARAEKLIGSSTEADVIIRNPSSVLTNHYDLLASLFVVSDVSFGNDVAASTAWCFSSEDGNVQVIPSRGLKCPRCWMHTRQSEQEETCHRCTTVIQAAT
ncbi:isoleucine-tRNA ligase [Microbotryomycetes sp. JL201]|nr:isoleucine-tRNA ligase [Microbotryomycetes sp. JL201]